ncbi:MAG: DNA repair protein RadC [Lachnospiraceae bacterium]|nr:DNA repair protein RadC [Lachnospiraceae bacterium]
MQPYEKFITLGASSLTDAELLAIMIRTGTKEKRALQVAEDLLDLLPGHQLVGLHRISVNDFMSLSGIGEVKAVRLKCIAELALRIAKADKTDELEFRNSASIAAYYMEQFRHLDHEQVMVVLLDHKFHRICERIVSVGTMDCAIVSPREIYREALTAGAAKLVMLHNHPSGDPQPSADDVKVTGQVKAAGELFRIPLEDHIIIGDHRYSSFAEMGYL